MAQSTRNFVKTLDSGERKGKIDIREKVLRLFDQKYANFNTLDRQFKMITLGSLYWIFEKAVMQLVIQKYYDNENKRGITIKSFEYDWKIFSVASVTIPSGKYAAIRQEISDMNYQVIKSNIGKQLISVHHIDVFDYLKQTDNMFDFMWIDLTSPIDFVQDKIIHATHRMLPEGILILSFSKGRERIKISDRIQFVMDRMELYMELIESIEYMDTVAMINIVMKKKYTLEDYNKLTVL